MPTIHLKPNSPEYADEKKQSAGLRTCEMPGCRIQGEYRAPKDRSLSEHYWFCYEHAQDYNKAWNYFSGMSQRDVEEHIIRSTVWDRPTWRYDSMKNATDDLWKAAWQTYNFSEKEPPKDRTEQQHFGGQQEKEPLGSPFSPEHQAMAMLGLSPPLTMSTIKTRYKELVKKHHPDLNPGDKKSEELLKEINMAYTILRLAYEKYDKLYKDEN